MASSDEVKEITRKRKRSKEEWTQNKRRELRNTGLSYVNTNNKTVPPRAVQPATCKCSYQCSSKFDMAQREAVIKEY